MDNDTPQNDNRLETIAALLIALVTVIGAVVAWRASVASDGAGDADFAGLRASGNAEEARALNFVNAYEHYGAYTTYLRYTKLGDAIADDLENSAVLTEEEAYLLDRQRAESYDLADANQDLFPNRFLSRDGSYSVAREMGEAWADASKEKDLSPDAHYAEADGLRAETHRVLGTLSLLAVSLVFFTLVEAAAGRLSSVMIGLGVLFAVAGTALALIVEFAS